MRVIILGYKGFDQIPQAAELSCMSVGPCFCWAVLQRAQEESFALLMEERNGRPYSIMPRPIQQEMVHLLVQNPSLEQKA